MGLVAQQPQRAEIRSCDEVGEADGPRVGRVAHYGQLPVRGAAGRAHRRALGEDALEVGQGHRLTVCDPSQVTDLDPDQLHLVRAEPRHDLGRIPVEQARSSLGFSHRGRYRMHSGRSCGWCPEQDSNLHGAFAPRDFTLPREFPPGADYLFTRMGCRALFGEGYCWDSPR